MSCVTIVDLAKMIKLGIQSFFIWGHVVSHLSKFDQVKFGQIKNNTLTLVLWTLNDFKLKSLNTKFVKLKKIYNYCFGQLSIWDSLDGLNLWFLNFDANKLVFGTLDCLKLKSFEYQVCSAHQDIQSLYRPFFHLRKFEQNIVQISQVCDMVSESLYEIQEFVTCVW